ncbi:MAG: excinuclease ABC subunit UvrC [Pseudodesulfovibrio sp.]|uniref:UvrABC system protein C n=1 Tax=Pseudodesulfovibrio aespoeensis (strain ATCC 700646 / DSM 10631 / Aspo-2) TaxID=643562 RepID=E6VU54_PSEA9|nr:MULTISPECIES: excinuclease ABC subunit UvrC [Pseudodesulfovibrio]MBU4193258.1 excinuclease ABC subunit UvrC [Pseudomonadota bacterium]ADU62247.1 excinuclease ABC, C subunit [Pseudodesulfovibrio aespoeensis Aspo-2]MBU4243298.1 excinuclease ABC subunit UvrC [Pseudomonadota bacterium]MBU4380542.1 excinuclease ABC subunit UvrC [Pseudomonadota bacterium]MBU4476610.1 excinuclease ABC subunit UvrC [Pseudomonadota bacterium]
MAVTQEFKFFAADYPDSPGVYLMKNARGRIIYVGKAKRLRRRLASYFQKSSGLTPKTLALVGQVCAVDVLLTGTEKEALLLEEGLIKKHRPRYNVVLKDDKQYVLFRLDRKAEFPRLSVTRKVVRDGSVYFGPFTSGAAARTTWKLLGKVFPLRKCSDHVFRNRVRPCLYHHLHQCLAPCVLNVDRAVYKDMVRRVEMLLSGKSGELLTTLEKRMAEASAAMEYEQAALLRDQIRAVRQTVEGQVAVCHDTRDRDVLGLAASESGLGLGLLFIRQGRLLDEKQFFWPGLTLDEGPEVIQSFVMQFYGAARFIPPMIIVPYEMVEPLVAEVLAERRTGPVRLVLPRTTQEKKLLELARDVARQARQRRDSISARLARALNLPAEPERIECVDASHLGGSDMRVGQVVFEAGRRDREASRLYAFPDLEGTGDDYAALAAWARRRVESGPPWPDLVLIDGGRGQLAAVERALSECVEETCWELVAIAKGPSRRAGELEDVVFRPGRKNPMPLKPGSAELLFLQMVRDTAHRFVLGRQRIARKKTVLQSELTLLPGIGPKTARLLWDRFESLDAMLAADPQAIRALPGIGGKKAELIHAALQKLRATG